MLNYEFQEIPSFPILEQIEGLRVGRLARPYGTLWYPPAPAHA